MMQAILRELKSALEQRTEWQVYDVYDPTPLAQRPGWFLTLGLGSLELQEPFLSTSYLYYPFSAMPEVTLYAPPETDGNTLYQSFSQKVFSGMLSAGCTVRQIRMAEPDVSRQLQRITLGGSFSLEGVFQMRKWEEAGIS